MHVLWPSIQTIQRTTFQLLSTKIGRPLFVHVITLYIYIHLYIFIYIYIYIYIDAAVAGAPLFFYWSKSGSAAPSYSLYCRSAKHLSTTWYSRFFWKYVSHWISWKLPKQLWTCWTCLINFIRGKSLRTRMDTFYAWDPRSLYSPW